MSHLKATLGLHAFAHSRIHFHNTAVWSRTVDPTGGHMAIEVNATPRTTQGKGASRRLRHAARVPGILYGAGHDARPIEVDHKELALNLKLESFHASILTLTLEGQ